MHFIVGLYVFSSIRTHAFNFVQYNIVAFRATVFIWYIISSTQYVGTIRNVFDLLV